MRACRWHQGMLSEQDVKLGRVRHRPSIWPDTRPCKDALRGEACRLRPWQVSDFNGVYNGAKMCLGTRIHVSIQQLCAQWCRSLAIDSVVQAAAAAAGAHSISFTQCDDCAADTVQGCFEREDPARGAGTSSSGRARGRASCSPWTHPRRRCCRRWRARSATCAARACWPPRARRARCPRTTCRPRPRAPCEGRPCAAAGRPVGLAATGGLQGDAAPVLPSAMP